MHSEAVLETDRAARYLSTLCHHFGRKVEAGCDGATGWVQFPFGRCVLTAQARRLTLVASAEDRARLAKVEEIITSHLDRFAFRENPQLDWRVVPERTAPV